MVANVHFPTSFGLNGLQTSRTGDQRAPSATETDQQTRGADAASTSSQAASLASLRDGLTIALGELDLAIGAGRLGLDALLETRSGSASPASGLSRYGEIIDEAIANGAGLLAGEDLTLTLEPGAEPTRVEGADLRLPESLKKFLQGAGSPPSSDTLDALSARVEDALGGFSAAARGLDSHSALLNRLEGALTSAGADTRALDADGARLTALQVSQTLAERGGGIASGSQSILALFR